MGEESRGEGDREPDRDRDERELHVLEERRLEDAGPVVLDPVGTEEAVLDDALAPFPEVGDDGLALRERSAHLVSPASASRVTTPCGSPLPSTTTSE